MLSLSIPTKAAAPSPEFVKTPAAANSLAPNLCTVGDGFALSWIERQADKSSSLRMALWNGKSFGEAHTIVTSKKMFANWADIPSVIEAPSGDLYAHWLERISSKTYAYGIRIVRSTDRGKTWQPMGWLHRDTSSTEHGFVSFAPDGKHVRAFWLDGRAMGKPGGKMMLRTALLAGNKITDERVLDEDVCTCCPVSAAQLPDGPMVIYRDRTPKQIRDISFTRRTSTGWTAPAPVHADGWLFPACPVNGASLATHGRHIAISRYTAANQKAKVILHLSCTDQPKSTREIVLDANNPIGRCVTVCTASASYTLWIAQDKNQATLQLAQVSHTGHRIRQATLTPINTARSSGMPRALISSNHLWYTWTDKNRVHLGRTKISNTPR